MEYSFESPLNGVQLWSKPFFDSHIHVWKADYYKMFIKWANLYYSSITDYYCLGMMQPEVKKEIPEELANNIVFAYYLSVKAFGHLDTKKLLEELDVALKDEYPMVKIWFAPRMIDYTKGEPGFRINNPRLDKVYEKIEDYGFKVIIHLADPDLWYLFKYGDKSRYGTKQERVEDFCDIMNRFSKIKFISAHLGSLPENLPALGSMLDKFPQLYLDTGSTRWMIRELGKDPKNSRDWFKKHKSRILFGSDLSIGEKVNPEYFTTRLWSHKVLWETNHKSKKLPFDDSDSPFGTKINGLALDEHILDQLYYKNAFKLFNLN